MWSTNIMMITTVRINLSWLKMYTQTFSFFTAYVQYLSHVN
jgi:hypothetical protein